MQPRAAAHVLEQIADLLELKGESSFKSGAYRTAARALQNVRDGELASAIASGALARVRGVAPATLAVIGELAAGGDSSLLTQLQEDTPEGLLEMLRVPGLGTSKIRAIHEGLGIDTLQDLEAAARDGRLAALPRFGAKTAAKIARGIAYLRETSDFMLYPHALAEAERLRAQILAVPGVSRAEIAGSIRRRCPVVRDIDIVAECARAPSEVAAEVARGEDVKDAIGAGGDAVTIRYADGTRLDLYCVAADDFEYALWRATGSEAHLRQVEAAISGTRASLPRYSTFEALATSARIAPELREGLGEVEAAELPDLITLADIRGVLHCHSQYSDGATTIEQMAIAARDRGWWYLGISDHSQSAAYAGGLSPDAVKRQHDEIDRLQERFHGFRILKGIEADILADGRVDYDESLLETFDYVIASVHSRFAMDERAMTERVLCALENPVVTILGHPTGRLLLTREPYAIDMPEVLARAGELGVAVELNADPHRLDLDWTLCRVAKELGCLIEIGPDAHSVAGLDNMTYGINTARKGWLEAGDVLNTQHAHDIVERARSRRVIR